MGRAGGEFISDEVSGTVKAGQNAVVGGIVGEFYLIYGTILGCRSSTDITVGGNASAGGLAGYSGQLTSITSSVADGKIKAHGAGFAGGAIGLVGGATITDVHAFGKVLGADNVGGLAGGSQMGASIVNSSATGAVSGSNMVGGLVGYNQSSIDRSYATGAVQSGPNSVVGGLIGVNEGHVTNAYAVGALNSTRGAALGGLVGANHVSGLAMGQLENSYAAVTVAGSATNVGGVIGSDEQPSNHAHDYWDTDTSGITDPSRGAGDVPNDGGLVAQTTGQLQAGLPNGLDSSIWGENAGTNNGFPYLLANPPQ